MQFAAPFAQRYVLAQIHILAQLRYIHFGHFGLHIARPSAPIGRLTPQPVRPFGRGCDRLAPASGWRQRQLHHMAPAHIGQTGLDLRNRQRRHLPLRIAPLHAAVANFKHRLLQQPVQRGIGSGIFCCGLCLPLRHGHARHVYTPICQAPGTHRGLHHGQASKPPAQQRQKRRFSLDRMYMQPFIAFFIQKAQAAQLYRRLQALAQYRNFADVHL